jgi:hypothetical protein
MWALIREGAVGVRLSSSKQAAQEGLDLCDAAVSIGCGWVV